jgi:hypothetical protein
VHGLFVGAAPLGRVAQQQRKPGMTRDDLFNINAGIVMNLVTACAKYCPNVSEKQQQDNSTASRGTRHARLPT